MAVTPELGLHIASPEETDKAFLEFRTEVYDSMMVIDQVVSDIKKTQEESYAASADQDVVQADFWQNDPTQPDYIKNRPCYESIREFTWNGDTTGRKAIGFSSRLIYNGLLLPRLADVASPANQYHLVAQCGDPYVGTADEPYAMAICSSAPFYYGSCVGTDGETYSSDVYSVDCDVEIFIYKNAKSSEWTFVKSTTYTGTSASDTDICRISDVAVGASEGWTNTDIVDADSGTVVKSASEPVSSLLGGDLYFITSSYMTAQDWPNIKYTQYIAEDGVSEQVENTVETVLYSEDAEDTFLMDYMILNASTRGVHGINDDGTIAYIYVDTPGIYCFGAFEHSAQAYVKNIVWTTVKKLSNQFLPFRYIIPSPSAIGSSQLDFSSYEEGEIVFIVGG